MSKVLYPGSFDPITKGHMNIIEEAITLFDEVVIAVLQNPAKKKSLFTLEERVEIIKEIYKNTTKVKVVTGVGASVDRAVQHNCQGIIRGLRSITDYDYEVGLSQINKDISNGKINTVCLFADKEYQFISSSIVKEILNLDKDITPYVSKIVKEKMLIKKRENKYGR